MARWVVQVLKDGGRRGGGRFISVFKIKEKRDDVKGCLKEWLLRVEYGKRLLLLIDTCQFLGIMC